MSFQEGIHSDVQRQKKKKQKPQPSPLKKKKKMFGTILPYNLKFLVYWNPSQKAFSSFILNYLILLAVLINLTDYLPDHHFRVQTPHQDSSEQFLGLLFPFCLNINTISHYI